MKLVVFSIIYLSHCWSSIVVLSNWKTYATSEHVQMEYRWISIDDTLKTREIRATFMVSATHETLAHNIRNCDSAKLWLTGIKKYFTFHQTADTWFVYSLFNIPKPFAQQDLVSQYQLTHHIHNKTVITIKACPKAYKKVTNVSRLKYYSAQWILYKPVNGQTKVEFYTTSYTHPFFPRFIQDPIVKRFMLRSFENYIALAENRSF